MKILDQLVEQFKTAHAGELPKEIIVAPLAAVVLASKLSLAPRWREIDVSIRNFDVSEVVEKGQGVRLGIFLKKTSKLNYAVRGCELLKPKR